LRANAVLRLHSERTDVISSSSFLISVPGAE
jgi:hypothetical protein